MDDRPAARTPMVSVVIPVRNRPAQIASCLGSLARVDYPRDRLEVLVVDDASTDGTREAIAEHAANRVRLLAQPEHRGQSACRNAGAREAAGEIVAFIDSDCEADPDWVRGLVAELGAGDVVASGGSVREALADSWLERFEAVYSPLYLGDRPARVQPGTRVDFLPSCNLAVRRAVFFDVGGFDESLRFGEDVDLVWRLCERGEVRYRPEAIVWHRYRGRFGPFVSTRVKYAAAQAVFLKRHPRNRRRLDLPAGLLFALVAAAVGVVRPWSLAAAGGVPFLEAVIALAAGGLERARRTVRGYASALYRAMSFVAGHYAVLLGLASAIAVIWWPPAFWGIVVADACLIVPAIVEWFRLEPPLDLPRFAVAYLLDRLAINVGTLLGCIGERTLQPLSLKIVLHAAAADVPEARAPASGAEVGAR